jgi:hypothetical protein
MGDGVQARPAGPGRQVDFQQVNGAPLERGGVAADLLGEVAAEAGGEAADGALKVRAGTRRAAGGGGRAGRLPTKWCFWKGGGAGSKCF